MDEFLNILMAHNELKKNYWDCIEADDFEGFSKNFKCYIKSSNSNEENPEIRNANQKIAMIKEFTDMVVSRKDCVDKIIDYFKRADFVSPENMLLSFWTTPENQRYLGYNKDHYMHNAKHLEFWAQGVKITKKHYKLYCQVMNKLDFMQHQEEFFPQQEVYIFNQKLNKKLAHKPYTSLKTKI